MVLERGDVSRAPPWILVLAHLWVEGFDSTGPAIAVGAACVAILWVYRPLGQAIGGKDGGLFVLLCLVVYFASLLLAVALTIVGRILLLAMGTPCQ